MDRVDLLSLEALPLVPATRARATRLPWRWVGRLDRPIVLGLAGAGIMRLRWDGFESGEIAAREELDLVDGDGRRGRVLVDRWLALNLVSGTLGLAPPRSLRRLGAGERGILAGHLAALLTLEGGRVVVDLAGGASPQPADPTGGVRLAFQAEAAGATGPIRIEAPAAWLTAASWPFAAATPPAAFGKAAARVETTARLEIADTVLSAIAVAAAAPGDIVVFDGVAYARAASGEGVAARVRIGEHETEGEARADGTIVVAGPFRPAPRRQRPIALRAPDALPVVKDATTMAEGDDVKLDLLAGAPVEVVAEIGRVTLRGDEVLGLERGSVLAFGRLGTRVDLVIGGRTWARGELVNVDGELGVRITEMSGA